MAERHVLIPVSGVPVASTLASPLSLPATGHEVAQFVALRAAACVGAEYSNLALLNADGSSLRLFHNPFLDGELAAQYSDVPLDGAYPVAVAAREGRVVLLPDLASYEKEFPGLVADTIAAGIQATASLPLYRLDGTLLGAIGFAWADPIMFSRKLEAALRAVANLCVETVERAERYDADHELIRRVAGQTAAQPSVARGGEGIGPLPHIGFRGDCRRRLVRRSAPWLGKDRLHRW